MKYLVLYAVAGIITLVFMLLQSHFEKKKHGPSFSDTMNEIRLQDASVRARFLEKIIVPVLAGIAVVCVWPIALVLLVKIMISQRRSEEVAEKPTFRVQEQDLIEQLSIDEIEKRERVEDPLGGVPDEPFGHLWPTWRTFVNELNADVKLWSFAATDDTSYTAVRLEGYAHFDNGEAGSVFITSKKRLSEDD